MNIYEKVLNITNEIKNVNKNLEVGVGKSSYKAVGEADILKAVKELEYKYKVYSYPIDRNIIDKDILQTRKEYNGQVIEGNQLFMRLEVIYRFVNIEKPEEFLDIKTYGDGIDTQDKAPGKAMTYADKYALMKAYKIITGEDPDQSPSPEKVKYNKQNKKESNSTIESKIETIDINRQVGFGKYKDKTWLEVYNENSKYFDWLIANAKSKQGAETYKKIKEQIENSYITVSDEEYKELDPHDVHQYDGAP